jgi:hypothetical protein
VALRVADALHLVPQLQQLQLASRQLDLAL